MDPEDPVRRIQIDTKEDVARILEENRDFYETLSPVQLVSVFQDMIGRHGNEFFNNYGRVIIDYPAGKDIRFEEYLPETEIVVVEFISFFKSLGHKNTDTYFSKDFVDFLRAYSILRKKDVDIDKLKSIGNGERVFELICNNINVFIETEKDVEQVIDFFSKYIDYLVKNEGIDLNESFEDDFLFCLFPSIRKNWNDETIITYYRKLIDNLLKNGLSNHDRLYLVLAICVRNDDFLYTTLLLDKGASLDIGDFNIYEQVNSAEMVDTISDWIRKHPERIDQVPSEHVVYSVVKSTGPVHKYSINKQVVKVDELKVEHVINAYISKKSPGYFRRPIALAADEDVFKAFIKNGSLFEISDLHKMIERYEGRNSERWGFAVDYIQNLFPEPNNMPFQIDENSKEDMLRWRKSIISVSNQIDAKKPVILPDGTQLPLQAAYNLKVPNTFSGTITGDLYGDLMTRYFGETVVVEGQDLIYIVGITGAVSARAQPSAVLSRAVNDRVRIEQYRIKQEQALGGKSIPGVTNKDMTRLITLLSREKELCANLGEHFDFAELIALYMYVSGDKLTPTRMRNIFRNFAEDPNEAKTNICADIQYLLSKRASNYSPPVSPVFEHTGGEELLNALMQGDKKKALRIIKENVEGLNDVPLVNLNEPVYTKDKEYLLPLSVAFATNADNLVIYTLLEYGARLDAKDGNGNTPVMFAYYTGHGDLLEDHLKETNPEMLEEPWFIKEKTVGKQRQIRDYNLIVNTF